jgi:hypothetical protein
MRPAAGVQASAPAAGNPDAVYSLHLVQRKANPDETRDGEIVLQRILETGTMETVAKALTALKKARSARSTDDPDPLTERKELPTEPDVVELQVDGAMASYLVAPRSTEAMIRVLPARFAELLGMQPDPKWVAFARGFNREFATVLNAFDLVAEAKDGERNDVMAIRLQYLFTDEQRELLEGFFATNLIPEGLFNGDHIGRTTAQQRILMAGHILANGKYRPGSFDQEVHALACYHWVRIVHHYAGATSRGLNQSMTGNFDHAGGAVLATGKTTEIEHAKRDDSLEVPEGSYQDQKHGEKAWRFGMVAWSTVQEMEPGDWLYIYNANGSISGAHSIIFAGWVGRAETDAEGRHYREARVMDQGKPEDGGRSRTTILGSDIFMLEGRAVTPVSQITRVNADAIPADTVDALTPDITGKVSSKNKEFIRKLGWKKVNAKKTFDVGTMNAWLKQESIRCIDALLGDGRLTPGQFALLLEAAGTDDNHTLVCLYQRVLQMAANSDALERNDDKTYDAKDEAFAKAEADQQARTDEIEGQIAPLEVEVTTLDRAMYPLEVKLDALDQSDEIKAAYVEWRRIRKERKALPKGSPERAARLADEEQVHERIEELEDRQREHKQEIKELRRTLKTLSASERRLETKIERLRARLIKDDPTADIYGLVHGGSRKGTIKETITGAYADIPGVVTWNDFMTEQEP